MRTPSVRFSLSLPSPLVGGRFEGGGGALSINLMPALGRAAETLD